MLPAAEDAEARAAAERADQHPILRRQISVAMSGSHPLLPRRPGFPDRSAGAFQFPQPEATHILRRFPTPPVETRRWTRPTLPEPDGASRPDGPGAAEAPGLPRGLAPQSRDRVTAAVSDAKPRLVLHVGAYKTATSTLQSLFSLHEQEIAAVYGIHYPEDVPPGEHGIDHRRPSADRFLRAPHDRPSAAPVRAPGAGPAVPRHGRGLPRLGLPQPGRSRPSCSPSAPATTRPSSSSTSRASTSGSSTPCGTRWTTSSR